MFLHATPWLLLLLAIAAAQNAYDEDENANMPSPLVELTETDWRDMLEGEWLVKLYAPWCPACKVTMHTWRLIANYSAELGIIIGQADVTEYPGLAGRFMARSLPTIYHVKNGVFRKYPGVDDYVEPVMSFLHNEKWQQLLPVPWYRVPTSLPMSIVAIAFRTARRVMQTRSHLTKTYGIPQMAFYSIGGIGLLVVGFGFQWATERIFIMAHKKISPAQAAKLRSDSAKTLEGLASDLSEDSSSNEESFSCTHSEADTERPERMIFLAPKQSDQLRMTDLAGDRAAVCGTFVPNLRETGSCGDHVKELAPRRRRENTSVMDSVYRVCSKSEASNRLC